MTWPMRVGGAAGLTYTVEASTNMLEWAPLESYASPSLPFEWSEPDAGRFPQRFCRVRAAP
jgi:hypothetical protein